VLKKDCGGSGGGGGGGGGFGDGVKTIKSENF